MDALGVPRMLGGGAGGRAVTAPLPPTPTTRAPSVNVDIKTEQGSVRVKMEVGGEGGAGEGGVAPVAKALKGLSLTLIEKIRAKEKEKNARLAAESGEQSQKESQLVMQFTK